MDVRQVDRKLCCVKCGSKPLFLHASEGGLVCDGCRHQPDHEYDDLGNAIDWPEGWNEP